MNTTTKTHRLTAAACAAILAVTFAGCASAAGSRGTAPKIAVGGAASGSARFVPDDNDPRGRHTVREWISLQAVDDVLSPLTSITSAELRDRYGARQAAPIESSQVDPSRVDRPRIDPRLTTAG